MKINYLKINGFGKIKNKEIKLNDNINIIYGKNESGKSTILNFINCMLYGASKNKNGKEISDYDKFVPWSSEEFSGKIGYTLDNKEEYEVYREFKKKVPTIYNSKMQDVSLNFNVDKTKGIDFIYEQTGLDEDTFKNTAIIQQNDMKIGKVGQNTIIQKISNMVSSGNENISFKKTMDKINKAQLENIGTERSTQKPINILNNEIEKLKAEKEEHTECKSLLENSDKQISEIEEDIEIEQNKLELFKCTKTVLDDKQLKEKEIQVIQGIQDDYNEKIENLENKIDRKAKRAILSESKSFTLFYIIGILLIILGITLFVVKKSILFLIVPIALAVITLAITIIRDSSFRKSKKIRIDELEKLENNIKQEIEILEKNKLEQEKQIEQKVNEENQELNLKKLEIETKYLNKVEKNFIDMVFEMTPQELEVSIMNKEERINSLKFDLQSKILEKNQLQEKVDNLSKIEEEIDYKVQEREELLKLNNSYEIAKKCMNSAYEKIRSSLSPEFMEKLNESASIISDGKYENVNFNDEDGLILEVENGKYMPIGRLSQGTIDQMYFSLRISSIDSISKEKMPIILDESFVYFDNNRLNNVLEFISKFNRQTIIFTCSEREIEALKKLKLDYNLIKLEN